jgi:phosphoglycolate phosphatase-like HAD superfamily hydrolase
MFRYHGIDGSEENRMQFISRYLKQLTTVLQESDGLVLPGVPSLLDALSERSDVLMGLLTGNLQAGAKLKLTHFNLDHHFRFGGYGDHRLERSDVARDAIKEVHRECNGNFELDRVWVIGDTPADVECGRAVGANVVAVGTGLYSMETLRSAEPDWLFEDFSDSAEFLDLLK